MDDLRSVLGDVEVPEEHEEHEVESVDAVEEGDIDFNIAEVKPFCGIKPVPGKGGKVQPYFTWGLAAIMVPASQVLSANGQQLAIALPLPPSGEMKLSQLKALANRKYREGRAAEDVEKPRLGLVRG